MTVVATLRMNADAHTQVPEIRRVFGGDVRVYPNRVGNQSPKLFKQTAPTKDENN